MSPYLLTYLFLELFRIQRYRKIAYEDWIKEKKNQIGDPGPEGRGLDQAEGTAGEDLGNGEPLDGELGLEDGASEQRRGQSDPG